VFVIAMHDHMRTSRRTLIGLAALLLVAATATTTHVGSSGATPKRKPLIVWLEPGAGNPYWNAQHRAAAEAGRRLGFSFRAVSGNLDPTDQAAILSELVEDDRVDLVMVNAIDPKSIGPSLLYARTKGVRTISLDERNPRASASIGFNERRSGRIAGIQALKLLREKGKAAQKVAVLAGIPGQPASDLRVRGFADYLTAEGVKVVAVEPTDWQGDNAATTMRDWLDKYPDLSLVYALSDTLAKPAMDVAEGRNRLCTRHSTWKANSSCVAFVSVDGFSPDLVRKGQLFFTELYSPYWTGYTYAKLAYLVATGQRFQKETSFDSLLVTPANAACMARMASDMKTKIRTFRFTGTLQRIASQYRCRVLDADD
jgi:ribose transport system substrate-binding protein